MYETLIRMARDGKEQIILARPRTGFGWDEPMEEDQAMSWVNMYWPLWEYVSHVNHPYENH